MFCPSSPVLQSPCHEPFCVPFYPFKWLQAWSSQSREKGCVKILVNREPPCRTFLTIPVQHHTDRRLPNLRLLPSMPEVSQPGRVSSAGQEGYHSFHHDRVARVQSTFGSVDDYPGLAKRNKGNLGDTEGHGAFHGQDAILTVQGHSNTVPYRGQASRPHRSACHGDSDFAVQTSYDNCIVDTTTVQGCVHEDTTVPQ